MRKLIIIAASLVALAVPTVAMADAPNGQLVVKDNFASSENASRIGYLSSVIKQNGQFVSGYNDNGILDQTTYPGSRADAVHAELGH